MGDCREKADIKAPRTKAFFHPRAIYRDRWRDMSRKQGNVYAPNTGQTAFQKAGNGA
jgi:hypothetical protein